LIGMTAVATDGSSLGTVKDITFDRQGRATHLVIAYGPQPQADPGALPNDGEAAPALDGKLTAMPWDAAMASIKNGQLVLDGAQLQAAPSFTASAWPNLDDPAWSDTADAYWRKAVQAAIEAHPGAPVDSTLRQRARPSRGGG
jgi:sporulation protein YlmC with PRC-barrel domain